MSSVQPLSVARVASDLGKTCTAIKRTIDVDYPARRNCNPEKSWKTSGEFEDQVTPRFCSKYEARGDWALSNVEARYFIEILQGDLAPAN